MLGHYTCSLSIKTFPAIKIPNLGQKVTLVAAVTLYTRPGLGSCCRYTEQYCTTPAVKAAKTDHPHDHIFN
jgi:hypothetical protein